VVKNAFDSFIDLITFDQSLFVMEKEIQTLIQEISHLDKVLLDYAGQLQAGQTKIKTLKKEVESKEHQMKDFDEQERKSKERLAGVKNDREHQAIKEEINRLKKKQHDYESTLMIAWNSLEALEKETHKHEQ
jgi:predicted  nucleic acid-binding Zn-ribbon protein